MGGNRGNLIGSCGLLVAVALACQSAQAGDRRSGSRQQDMEEIFVVRKAHATSLREQVLGALTDDRSKEDRKTRGGATPAREHKALTLFHINSKFGDIEVQPVMGQVNGAQFSIGF